MMQRTSLLAAIAALTIAAAVADAHWHDHDWDHHHHHHHDGDDVAWQWDWDLGNKTLNQAFSHCLCWNATSNNWCYTNEIRDNATFHKGGAGEFWARRSCQQLVTHLYWWVFPALCLLGFFALFPIFFFLARMLCNCCGGRNPTYGCCCPVDNKFIHQAQVEGVKKFKRPYSRCTTGWAKLLALAALATYITVSTHSFIGSVRSHDAVEDVTIALNTTAANMESGAQAVLVALTNLTEKNLTHVDLATLRNEKKQYAEIAHDISKALHGVKKAESHDADGGVFGWTIRVIAVPLFFIALVTILAFCNVRGCVISGFMGLLSYLAFFMCLFWIISLSLTETMDLACDNYNTSFAPFVVDMIHNNDGCGSATAIDGINRTETNYLTALCSRAGLASACATGALNCPVNACNKGTYVTASNEVFVNVSAINQMVALARTTGGQNLTACAADASCSANAVAKAVNDVVGNFASAVAALDNEFTQLYNCNGLRNDLQTVVYKPVCHSLVPKFHHLSVLLIGLTIVMFCTMFIWIYGAKRFTKGESCDEIQRYQELVQQPQDGVVVNALPAGYPTANPTDATEVHVVQDYPSKKEDPLLPAQSNFVANYGASTSAV